MGSVWVCQATTGSIPFLVRGHAREIGGSKAFAASADSNPRESLNQGIDLSFLTVTPRSSLRSSRGRHPEEVRFIDATDRVATEKSLGAHYRIIV